jgi:RNA polymerase sigma-70 factor (ECF subfamily)
MGVRDAEHTDALQEVFLVVYQKLPAFEGRAKLTTWLFGIAMRVASTRRRTAHVRREVLDGDLVLSIASDRAGAEDEIERRERIEMVERILDHMSIEQRVVFTLFEIEGLSGEEIADLVGAPKSTVYSRLRAARAAFREHADRLRAQEQSRLRMVVES